MAQMSFCWVPVVKVPGVVVDSALSNSSTCVLKESLSMTSEKKSSNWFKPRREDAPPLAGERHAVVVVALEHLPRDREADAVEHALELTRNDGLRQLWLLGDHRLALGAALIRLGGVRVDRRLGLHGAPRHVRVNWVKHRGHAKGGSCVGRSDGGATDRGAHRLSPPPH